MRFTCETCPATGTGSWKIGAGRPTVCCDDCNPANGTDLPAGFSYVRWFPMPDVSQDILLEYVSADMIAREYGRP